MSYVFVSHAWDDKRERIKPLVQALMMEDVRLWVDQPDQFGFDERFTASYGLRGLANGALWDAGVIEAVREAGAVLVCLSRALNGRRRQILEQEILLGVFTGKLVSCIVDDLPETQIPGEMGLVNISKLQSHRIDPLALSVAVDWLRSRPGTMPDALDEGLRQQWSVVRKLKAAIHEKYRERGLQVHSAAEVEAARARLVTVPVAPMVHPAEIPLEVIGAFADHYGSSRQARTFFTLAMQILGQANPEGFKPQQILLRSSEVIDPDINPADRYWGHVLAAAGRKSRRTLAAFLLAPGAPGEGNQIFRQFREWLGGR